MTHKLPLTYLIIGTTECPYCVAAKNLLNECRLAYDEELITMDEARERGYSSVPQIFYGGYYVGGFTELYARLRQTHLP